MHFGLYLKKQGIISAEQLVAAMEEQLHTLVPIGQLALEEGVLSVRDIFTILRAQSESPHERFGELAIELGLMTRPQLKTLLVMQADRKRPISEILVRQGAITEQECATELVAYRRDSRQPRREATVTRVVRPPMGQGAITRMARMANQGSAV